MLLLINKSCDSESNERAAAQDQQHVSSREAFVAADVMMIQAIAPAVSTTLSHLVLRHERAKIIDEYLQLMLNQQPIRRASYLSFLPTNFRRCRAPRAPRAIVPQPNVHSCNRLLADGSVPIPGPHGLFGASLIGRWVSSNGSSE